MCDFFSTLCFKSYDYTSWNNCHFSIISSKIIDWIVVALPIFTVYVNKYIKLLSNLLLVYVMGCLFRMNTRTCHYNIIKIMLLFGRQILCSFNNLIHTLFTNQSDSEYISVVYSCHGLVDLYNLFFIYVKYSVHLL
jgi:hypothetical protein